MWIPRVFIPSGKTRDDEPEARDTNIGVVPHFATWWRELGEALGISPYKLDIINTDHPNSCEERCKVMLREWKKQELSPTWGKLINAADSVIELRKRRERFGVVGESPEWVKLPSWVCSPPTREHDPLSMEYILSKEYHPVSREYDLPSREYNLQSTHVRAPYNNSEPNNSHDSFYKVNHPIPQSPIIGPNVMRKVPSTLPNHQSFYRSFPQQHGMASNGNTVPMYRPIPLFNVQWLQQPVNFYNTYIRPSVLSFGRGLSEQVKWFNNSPFGVPRLWKDNITQRNYYWNGINGLFQGILPTIVRVFPLIFSYHHPYPYYGNPNYYTFPWYWC